jgi:hypothetical protein
MSHRLWPRIGAASGLAYFVLALVGNAIATSGSSADESSSGAEILRDLQSRHGAAFQIGTVMELLSFLALLSFVAYLAGVLRGAEGEDGWLWMTAFGGGLLTIAIKLSSAAPLLAAVWRVDELDATTARTLSDINNFAFFISFATFAMLVGSAAIIALRTGLLNRWLAIAGIVLAVAQLATMAIGLTAAAIPPFVLSAIWLATVSAILTRRVGAPRTIPAPSSMATTAA